MNAREAGVSIDVYVREAVLARLLRDASDADGSSGPESREHPPEAEPPSRSTADPSVASAIEDPGRLRALRDSGLLDSPPDAAFDRIVRLAAEALDAPTAAVSLVTDDHQYFKNAVGLSEEAAEQGGTPLSHSLCQYAVGTREPLIVEDAREHPVLRENGAVREHHLVAYLGIPLTDADGNALGTLCVWDAKPREWSQGHVQVLADLARMVAQRIPDPGTA